MSSAMLVLPCYIFLDHRPADDDGGTRNRPVQEALRIRRRARPPDSFLNPAVSRGRPPRKTAIPLGAVCGPAATRAIAPCGRGLAPEPRSSRTIAASQA